MPKRKPKYEKLADPQNRSEALNYILMGWKYFLLGGWMSTTTTLVITAWLLFTPFVVGYVYLTSKVVTIKMAEPVPAEMDSTDHSSLWNFSLIPEAFAQTKQDATRYHIAINGKHYGDYDPNYVVYVMQGNPKRLFVYNKTTNAAILIDAPFLKEQDLKQYAK